MKVIHRVLIKWIKMGETYVCIKNSDKARKKTGISVDKPVDVVHNYVCKTFPLVRKKKRKKHDKLK